MCFLIGTCQISQQTASLLPMPDSSSASVTWIVASSQSSSSPKGSCYVEWVCCTTQVSRLLVWAGSWQLSVLYGRTLASSLRSCLGNVPIFIILIIEISLFTFFSPLSSIIALKLVSPLVALLVGWHLFVTKGSPANIHASFVESSMASRITKSRYKNF